MLGVKNTYKENSDGGNWSTQIISKNGGGKNPTMGRPNSKIKIDKWRIKLLYMKEQSSWGVLE